MTGGNVKPTLHNLVVITLLAAIGGLIAAMAARTALGNMPVLGTGLKLIAGLNR